MVDWEKPLFSVVVLTYMQRHLLKACVDSIFEQDYPNIEIVVCDDCSADFDPDEVRDYILNAKSPNVKNVVVVKQSKNVGTSQNARLAVQHSSGAYFKLHAGDDMLYGRDALTAMARYLETPDVNIVAARSLACQYDGTMTDDCYPDKGAVQKMMGAGAQEQFTMLATQSWGQYISAPAVFWRRDFYDETGGFDPKYKYTEDWPMWLRITKAGHRITAVDKVTTIYRYGGISNDQNEINADLRKEHYEECAQMLEHEALPALEQRRQKLKIMRCKQSIWCLQAMITHETQWNDWSVPQKAVWKCRNAGYLFLSWLYRLRTGDIDISLRNEIILAVGIVLIYHFCHFHTPVCFTVNFDALCVAAFFAVLGFITLKIAFFFGIKYAVRMIPLMKRRRK